LKCFNSASKCLKVIKFSKPEKKFPKNQVEGDIPIESFEGWGDHSPLIPSVEETLHAHYTAAPVARLNTWDF
jgi:hypothetical protein